MRGETHRVEIKDNSHPLLAYVDGIPVPIDWVGQTVPTFDLTDRRARLVRRLQRPSSFSGWLAFAASAILGGGASAGPELSGLVLEVDDAIVTPKATG
jgi:hypothetical protein